MQAPARTDVSSDALTLLRQTMKTDTPQTIHLRDYAPPPYFVDTEDLDIDIVLECTGQLTSRDKASAHVDAGAKRVLVSAPSRGAEENRDPHRR